MLASLDDDAGALDAAYDQISNQQLDAVFSAASGRSSFSGQSGYTVSFKPQPLADILDAAASSDNAQLKARVFKAGASQLEAIRDSDSLRVNPLADEQARPVTDAMTGLLRSDTASVVGELELGETDRNGKAVTLYNKELLNSGQEGVIGRNIADMQTGNGRSSDPVAYMGQKKTGSGGDPYYDHAENLGYYSGSVQAAIDSKTDDAKDQAELVGNIFSTTLGVLLSSLAGRRQVAGCPASL